VGVSVIDTLLSVLAVIAAVLVIIYIVRRSRGEHDK